MGNMRTFWAVLAGTWVPLGAPGMSRRGSGGRFVGGVAFCIMSISLRCSGQPKLVIGPLASSTYASKP